MLLRIASQLQPPHVQIRLTPSFPVQPGQEVAVRITADSLSGDEELSLFVDGNELDLDEFGRASVLKESPGKLQLRAQAISQDGLIGEETTQILVVDPQDIEPPELTLISPSLGSVVETAAPVRIDVSDANLDDWTLELARLGSDDYVTVASGEDTVSNQIVSVLSNPAGALQMSQGALSMAMPDAPTTLADMVEDLAKKGQDK